MAEKKNRKFPMKKSEFLDGAKPISLQVNGTTLVGKPKEFSTGSVGYNISGKFVVEVNGVPMDFQFSGNGIAIGSKEAE